MQRDDGGLGEGLIESVCILGFVFVPGLSFSGYIYDICLHSLSGK